MSERIVKDDKAYIRLFNQNTKLSKRVKELEVSIKEIAESLRRERQQNKRYREAIEKAIREMEQWHISRMKAIRTLYEVLDELEGEE